MEISVFYGIITGCLIVFFSTTVVTSLKDAEEQGGIGILVGILSIVFTVYTFPWSELMANLGLADLPPPGIVSLAGVCIALVLVSLFAGLHLSDLVASLLEKQLKKKGD